MTPVESVMLLFEAEKNWKLRYTLVHDRMLFMYAADNSCFTSKSHEFKLPGLLSTHTWHGVRSGFIRIWWSQRELTVKKQRAQEPPSACGEMIEDGDAAASANNANAMVTNAPPSAAFTIQPPEGFNFSKPLDGKVDPKVWEIQSGQ